MWGMVSFAVLIRLVIFLAMTYAPDTVRGPEIGVLLFSATVAAVHFGALRVATRKQQRGRDGTQRL